MSWNGFSKRISTKLIKQMTPNADQTQTNFNNNENKQLPRIYIRLPYIGKRGTDLIRNFRTKILRLLDAPCNIIIYWDTMTTSCLVSCKDKTPKEFQSSVVYKFSCPGCSKSYIGKTDRCLYTRLNEHATTDKSEIYKHITTCEHFTYLTNLMKLNLDDSEPNERFDLTLFLLHNSIILDKAKHWSVLLFKEALAIHRQKPELNHGIKASRELLVFY